MHTREAVTPDTPSIQNVHAKAFGDEGAAIAELVVALLHTPSAQPLLSLVAETRPNSSATSSSAPNQGSPERPASFGLLRQIHLQPDRLLARFPMTAATEQVGAMALV